MRLAVNILAQALESIVAQQKIALEWFLKNLILPVEQVQDQILVPGACFFEIAYASAYVMAQTPLASSLALASASIPAPLLMVPGASQFLECSISNQSKSPTLTIQSFSNTNPRRLIHLTSSTATITSQGPLPAPPTTNTPTPSALARHLARSIPAVQTTGGFGVAAIENKALQAGSGYFFHPASLDACLHIGASAGLDSSSSPSAGIRVPVGLAALSVQHRASTPSARASMGGAELLPSTAALSDYSMATSSGATIFGLSRLEARPMRLSTAVVAPKSIRQQSADILFTVEWRADTPLACSPISGSLPQPSAALEWRVPADASGRPKTLRLRSGLSGHKGLGSRLGPGLAMLAMSAQSLALVQQNIARGLETRTRGGVASSFCGARVSSRGASAASALALAKVAAQEAPRVSWPVLDVSELAPASLEFDSPQTDAFGAKLSESAFFRPQMMGKLPEAPDVGPSKGSLSGSVLVTGGLGAIGSLMASWAASNPSVHIWLAGRSGRAPADSQSPAHQKGQITSIRCVTCQDFEKCPVHLLPLLKYSQQQDFPKIENHYSRRGQNVILAFLKASMKYCWRRSVFFRICVLLTGGI